MKIQTNDSGTLTFERPQTKIKKALARIREIQDEGNGTSEEITALQNEVKELEKQNIKTIDLKAKEWFDKVNGNSYFSARMVINYGMPTEQTIVLPFQYGYGEHYQTIAMRKLLERKLISADEHTALWRYCDENKIVLRCDKIDRCLKREVKEFALGILPENKCGYGGEI